MQNLIKVYTIVKVLSVSFYQSIKLGLNPKNVHDLNKSNWLSTITYLWCPDGAAGKNENAMLCELTFN